MNSDALDKWLQKNVTHSEDTPPAQSKPKEEKKSPESKDKKNTDKPKKRFFKPKTSHQKPAQNNGPAKTEHFKKGKKHLRPNPNSPKKVRIIPLGGLNEVGKNMMAIEYGNDIIIIDMGLQFPEEDMLGVDYIVPDISYLQENQDKIRGVLITHGHLDHIGAIPYLAPKLQNPTFYGLPLTIGFIEKQTKEAKDAKGAKLIKVEPRQKIKLGVFTCSFFRVNHSIPDSTGIIIDTPEGKIVHTGDFKFDFTPADGQMADIETLEKLGSENVLALLSDSTNSTKPGHTMSEQVVGDALDEIITKAEGRLIIASFASLIGRMQQIIDSAKRNNRTVYITGRSMIQNIAIAEKLGYIKYPKGLVRDLKKNANDAQKPDALIITTGSQGESLAALTRMAMNEHSQININSNDTIVYSSSPIVGNERAVNAVVNELTRKGATVISNKIMDVHTSGHGQQEDLKLMINKVKPRFFIPVHGEYYMRHAHAKLAQQCGIPEDNCILADNGSVIECFDNKVRLSKEEVDCGHMMVDNQNGSISDIASHIISERQAMSLNGIITPVIIVDKKSQKSIRSFTETHGFIFMRETDKVIAELNKEARQAYDNYKHNKKGRVDWEKATVYIKGQLDRKIIRRLERRPLINPIIIQV